MGKNNKPTKPEDIAISVKNVSKSFKLPHEKQNSVKGAFINMFRGKKTYEKQQALKDISFDIKKGEFFGIVGRNGSGKSTLLKLISGIYAPDKGSITVNGKLVPFIELGVGFNPDLSGRENVFLNGALLGFSREEMEGMYGEIVEFAELERFMDQKLKNYSSGMQVRLAFSIAIRAKADILVLDEVLAVGDEAFQRKCYAYFAELKKDNKTVILVTHDMASVERFCTRAFLIEDGIVTSQGRAPKVAQKYRELFVDELDRKEEKEDGTTENKNIESLVTHKILNGNWVFNIQIKPKKLFKQSVLAFVIFNQSGQQVWNWASDYTYKSLPDNILQNKFNLEIKIEDIFPVDAYYANLYIKSKDRSKDIALFDEVVKFTKSPKVDMHKYDTGWQPHSTFDIISKIAIKK